MRVAILAFFLGICCVQIFQHVPAWYYAGLACLGSSWVAYHAAGNYWRIFLIFCSGLLWALCHASFSKAQVIPSALEEKPLCVLARIVSIPHSANDTLNFTAQITSITQKFTSLKVSLNWHNAKPPLFRIGDEWRCHVRLKKPHDSLNPNTVDREKILFQKGIDATGYVMQQQPIQLISTHIFRQPIDRLRQSLALQMAEVLPLHSDSAAIIPALTLGLTDAISQHQWQVFRNTGTNHLVAISGLHIGMMAGLSFLLSSWWWRQFPSLVLRIPTPKAAAFAGLIAAVIYCALAGFALPTQRALIMLLVWLLAVLMTRPLKPWQAWCMALMVVLLWEPMAILSMSFWLSFTAVACIIYGCSGRLTLMRLNRWWQTQWTVTLGLIPLLLYFFQQASVTSLLANTVAIPWMSIVVVPLCLLGTFALLLHRVLAQYTFYLANKTVACLWWYLDLLAKHEDWQLHIAYLTLGWSTLCLCLGIVWVLAPRGLPSRYIAIIWLLPVMLLKPSQPIQGHVWLTLLDVGQGLAVVVQTHNHVLVYDSGARFNDYDAGSRIVLPFLRSLAVHDIDAMVISHADNDHAGGANSILREMQVRRLFTSVPELFKGFSPRICQQGSKWQWDGVQFDFLYPPSINLNDLTRNDHSCVLRIKARNRVILLPGDIERRAEHYLVQQEKSLLSATILIVPHHGSRTSSSLAFIRAIQPSYALFAVGYKNRYGLPKPVVLQRYSAEGVQLRDTSRCGAIIFTEPAQPVCYREKYGHFWNR